MMVNIKLHNFDLEGGDVTSSCRRCDRPIGSFYFYTLLSLIVIFIILSCLLIYKASIIFTLELINEYTLLPLKYKNIIIWFLIYIATLLIANTVLLLLIFKK